jgi:hypothetical protein
MQNARVHRIEYIFVPTSFGASSQSRSVVLGEFKLAAETFVSPEVLLAGRDTGGRLGLLEL